MIYTCHLHPVLLYSRLKAAELLFVFLSVESIGPCRKTLVKEIGGNEGWRALCGSLPLTSKASTGVWNSEYL